MVHFSDDGMLKVGFCVSGAGSLFRAAVLRASELKIAPAILILDDKASPDLEAFCSEHHISCARIDYQDRQDADSELTRRLVSEDLGLICLTFDKLLPPGLVDHYAGRIINVHMALLPAFKGFRAI